MSISDLDLVELKSRAANAIRTNSSVANVDSYIDTLKAEIGKVQPVQKSTASTPTGYLYQLILQAESMGAPAPAEKVEEAPAIELAPEDDSWEDVTDQAQGEPLSGPAPESEMYEDKAKELPPAPKESSEKSSKRKKDKRP